MTPMRAGLLACLFVLVLATVSQCATTRQPVRVPANTDDMLVSVLDVGLGVDVRCEVRNLSNRERKVVIIIER